MPSEVRAVFEKVVVGVDGREGGRDALALAQQLAPADAELTLVNVRTEQSSEDSIELLGRVAQECGIDASGVDAKLVSVPAHSPGAGLHLQAELNAADLLVVGSCARSLLGRARLGDDTRAALTGAPCAVAIAAKGMAACGSRIATVGVAYDGSVESAAALEAARAVAARNGAALHAMKVVMAPYAGYVAPGMRQSTQAILDQAWSELDSLPGVVAHTASGLPGPELVSFGDEVDILVTGSRGYGPLRSMLMGSTSVYLERHARCSLLVLPRTGAVIGDIAVVDQPATKAAPELGPLGVAWRGGGPSVAGRADG